MKYQKPVQGMRAFAVIIVILNHLGVSGFSGGFIGVDVFFVISGYLISGLLVDEYYNKGKISIANFYSRRIKRIFPALFVTVFTTAVIGFLILSEERLGNLIDSSTASIFSVSNIFFWSQIGYFDAEAIEKPLLHTWSLGVEEQFYLIWPLLIISLAFLKTRARIAIGIGVVALGSFMLNAYMLKWNMSDMLYSSQGFRSSFLDEASTVFYLMPFRIFEFGIGAVLGVLFFSKHPKISTILSDCFFVFSSAIIIAATVFLDSDSVFPYYNALIVSCAAALMVYSSFNSGLAEVLIGNKFLVFIGGLSYSLYLVHWPIISYYSMLFGSPTLTISFLLIALMVFLAWGMFVLVEQPARRLNFLSPRSSIFYNSLSKVMVVTSIAFFAFLLNEMKGVDWRIPEHRKTLTNEEWRELEKNTYCQDEISGFPEEVFTCQNDRNSQHNVIAWGDSHANHLIAGLSEIFPESNILISYLSGCIPQSGFNGLVRDFSAGKRTQECIDRNESFMNWASSYQGSALIFLTSAKRNTPEQVSEINNMLVQNLEASGHAAFVLGDFIRPGNQIAQCRSVPDFILTDEMLNVICTPNESDVTRELAYSVEMARLSKNYIPVHETQCPDGKCTYSDDKGRSTYRDHHHLSMYGSEYEMKKASPNIYQYTGTAISESSAVGVTTL